ncbi:AbiJ-NTD4 domain-containing protein [Dokdonella soli]|uniref:HEPN AbiJ-N-terminal domain-containing protein n=1 Tax=Dokdonella soli TaxID=529810 RepID=A0ABP3U642_9GAMM
MRFSQRLGLAPASKVAQRECMDDDLRSSLWSLLTLFYWDTYEPPYSDTFTRPAYVRRSNLQSLMFSLWLHFFKQPIDTIDVYWEQCHKRLRDLFFRAEWNEVYDFVEFVAEYGPERQKDTFIESCNSYLETENSAYRFVSGQITEITSEEEIAEVDSALANASAYAGTKAHLTAALALLSSRTNPDYRNSIKESISAVESLAKKLAKDDSGTLGSVLKALEKSKKLHPALKNAFSSLYGYTSDADGIRHALLDEPNLTKADARFMLICCSAFINYSIEAFNSE